MNKELKFEVIEDNGGGLSLFVFDTVNGIDTVVYSHSGYEYSQGQLAQNINEIISHNCDITQWGGCEDDPQANYSKITSHDEYGYKTVMEKTTETMMMIKVYLDDMGLSAQTELDCFCNTI